ncbi:MAG: HAMP domain-containing histidine kinase [Nitrososphaeraceae archaeon]|nr:HAMP domain-containing histidine kinase [Nitrososphaeraceae archaeon]
MTIISTNNTTAKDKKENIEKTEVLNDPDKVINTELQFFSNSNKKIDTCMNYTRPSLTITLEPIKKAFLDAKSRGVKLRYITEITPDNIPYCKDLKTIVDELRHLDGIKGNFMISELEYLVPIVSFEKLKVASQIIYSNVKEIVDQHQYMFDTLWSKAMLADQRIREIEEGIEPIRTRLIENEKEIIKEIKRKNIAADKLSICTGIGGMKMSYNYLFDSYKNIVDKYKEGKNKEGLRWITSINDKETADLVKLFLQSGLQVRHIKNMPPLSFGVSDKEVSLTIETMEGGIMSQRFLISNEPLYVSHFNSLFDQLWQNGTDVINRIREIEEGVFQSNIEIIQNPEESIKLAFKIIRSAKEEVLRVFSSVNAFRRQVRFGIMNLFKEMVEENHGIKVRILLPAACQQQITQIINEEAVTSELYYLPSQINIRSIDKNAQTSIGILVVDTKESLIIETKDDTKDNSYDAAGLSVYSDSKPIALSYASIFESLWKQSELYQKLNETFEQLKIHDKMQKDFINIAAHELRTPMQPILGLTGIVRSKTKDPEERELLDVVIRNAKRLQKLTEDILDVTKIESQLLQLNKEQFNLTEMISNVIADCKNQLQKENNIKIELVFKEKDFFVVADKARLYQVIMNLLSNAIKFTQKEGIIIITVEKEEEDGDSNSQILLVSIKDSGTGIDPEIFPRLFSRFVTKPETGGTGLGLFISKNIVEAHGGRMWAQNNKDDNERKGATFTFTLPVSTQQQQPQTSLPV